MERLEDEEAETFADLETQSGDELSDYLPNGEIGVSESRKKTKRRHKTSLAFSENLSSSQGSLVSDENYNEDRSSVSNFPSSRQQRSRHS